MTAKKIAATLGTGTLGAGGAAGAAAWKLSLGSEKSLEPAPAPSESHSEPGTETNTDPGSGKESSAPKTYFDNATTFDKKAVDSNNWKTEQTKRGETTIKIEEGGDTWQCTIKAAVFDNSESKVQSISNQLEEFVNKIKTDATKREKFVENCAGARLNAEKSAGGKVSTIELELDEKGENLKNLDSLLEGKFLGLSRIEEKHKDILGNTEEGLVIIAKEEEVGKKKTGKIIVTLNKPADNKVFCSIYGKLEGTNFDDNKFDYLTLNEIFMSETTSWEDDDVKYTKEEKRKFMIRNCSDNNGTIEGVKVVFDSEKEKWKIENLEKELLTKTYKNPEDKKAEKSVLAPSG